MKKILISLGSVITLGLPVLVMAAGTQVNLDYLGGAINSGKSLLNNIIIFLFALAVVWFIWNVTKYSMSSEEDGKDKARTQMINGIIAIAVMVSIWGIVGLLRNAFGVDSNEGAPNSINNMIPGVTVAPTSYPPNGTAAYINPSTGAPSPFLPRQAPPPQNY